MSLVSKLGKHIFPSVFAPKALGEISPTWSGIFLRIFNPTRTHPAEHYKITSLSRKEIKMLDEVEEQKLSERFNPIFVVSSDKKPKKD
jgi:hypothetical protein